MLAFEFLQVFLSFGEILFGLCHLLGLVIEDYVAFESAIRLIVTVVSSIGRARAQMRPTDEISILEVEAVQLVTSLLSIHDIFIDNKSSAFGISCNPLANLATSTISQVARKLHRLETRSSCSDSPHRSEFAK